MTILLEHFFTSFMEVVEAEVEVEAVVEVEVVVEVKLRAFGGVSGSGSGD